MKCPSCGSPDEGGKYCAECGTALRTGCASCGTELPPGGRYCPQCGTRAASGAGARARELPWPWIAAGAAVAVVLLVLLLPRRTDPAGPGRMTTPGAAPPAGATTPGSGGPVLSADMRTNADRLFNRVMAAAERGDRAEVARFIPMAIQAYGMVDELDADGLYHLAILHRTAGNDAGARATAERILQDHPDHILALGLAAAAAEQAGDSASALAYHRRLLDAYATEAARPLPEYLDHQRMLPEYRRAAQERTGEE